MGIAPDLPYEIIIGRDLPLFSKLASMGLDSFTCAEQEERVRDLGEKQKRDPTLREAWLQAEKETGRTVTGAQLVIKGGVMYRISRDHKTREEITQVVLPSNKRGST